mmetsp:Transcript_20436/g.33726  ORF Transcript_20436/g.33726 Transcript_20436/m.33726 type:complete len:130 (+) Transcript_20436:723-1112(+)|eukprot:CAMPEP_0203761470 /NCGR_PEP_ID=MMETSP0098-20131031/14554_1 /ASSEMBLY_ACC=CAM_ASM_000208 /TAXON_ID=96639 /ORGANISM=" , Strain NY0313808BC1" /LENGTH=129 /DNA_ID=CAMNT_0050655485 /DNA_START=218 /DNA_END=607 /DNA_ORIENTATION=-
MTAVPNEPAPCEPAETVPAESVKPEQTYSEKITEIQDTVMHRAGEIKVAAGDAAVNFEEKAAAAAATVKETGIAAVHVVEQKASEVCEAVKEKFIAAEHAVENAIAPPPEFDSKPLDIPVKEAGDDLMK